MTTLLAFLQPYLLELISTLALAVVTWLARTIKHKFDLDIEEKHRLALHEAIMSGVELALEDDPVRNTVVLGHVKNKVREHVYNSVPNAVAALIPGDTVLDAIAVRYINRAIRKLP